jgi:hypothetical protein
MKKKIISRFSKFRGKIKEGSKKIKTNFTFLNKYPRRRKLIRILAVVILIGALGATPKIASAYPPIFRMPEDGEPRKDWPLVVVHALIWFILGCLKPSD